MTSSRVRLQPAGPRITSLVSGRAGAYADIVGPPKQVWPGPGVSQAPPGPSFDYYCNLAGGSDGSEYCSNLGAWAERSTSTISSTQTVSQSSLGSPTETR